MAATFTKLSQLNDDGTNLAKFKVVLSAGDTGFTVTPAALIGATHSVEGVRLEGTADSSSAGRFYYNGTNIVGEGFTANSTVKFTVSYF